VCKPADGPKGPWQSVKERRQKISNSSGMTSSQITSPSRMDTAHKNSKLDRNEIKSNLSELADYTARNTDLEEDMLTI
jgi:hypothetical protein